MLTYYKIPREVDYIQKINQIEEWEKLERVDPEVPTAIVIEDSKATHYGRFVVAYKGKMQFQGGSGSCYNPAVSLDNSIMPKHMSKWVTYDHLRILQLVAHVKYKLLEKLEVSSKLPFFVWNCENYDVNPGFLISQLDAVGMNQIDPSCIKKEKRKQLLLLTKEL